VTKIGNGDMEQRMDRVERWIEGHQTFAQERSKFNEAWMERIEENVCELQKQMGRVNIIVGIVVIVGSVIGNVLASYLAGRIG